MGFISSQNNWMARITHGFISLVNDNHVDNLKKMMVYVYFGQTIDPKRI